MNTTASVPFFVPSSSTDRVTQGRSRSHNPVVQALEVVGCTAALATALVLCAGIVHALITLV